jgi:hypothetical protein
MFTHLPSVFKISCTLRVWRREEKKELDMRVNLSLLSSCSFLAFSGTVFMVVPGSIQGHHCAIPQHMPISKAAVQVDYIGPSFLSLLRRIPSSI